jgi:hypothetical protein
MNVSKHSISFSLKIGRWLSINTRGNYFINGPGPFDWRGKWRQSSHRDSRPSPRSGRDLPPWMNADDR